MAFSEIHSLTKMIDEWHKLHDLLEHWQSSVKDKGFMDPVSVLDEEGKMFETIWFARSVCGQSLDSWPVKSLLTMHSLLLANVPPCSNTPLDYQSFTGPQ